MARTEVVASGSGWAVEADVVGAGVAVDVDEDELAQGHERQDERRRQRGHEYRAGMAATGMEGAGAAVLVAGGAVVAVVVDVVGMIGSGVRVAVIVRIDEVAFVDEVDGVFDEAPAAGAQADDDEHDDEQAPEVLAPGSAGAAGSGHAAGHSIARGVTAMQADR